MQDFEVIKKEDELKEKNKRESTFNRMTAKEGLLWVKMFGMILVLLEKQESLVGLAEKVSYKKGKNVHISEDGKFKKI